VWPARHQGRGHDYDNAGTTPGTAGTDHYTHKGVVNDTPTELGSRGIAGVDRRTLWEGI